MYEFRIGFPEEEFVFFKALLWNCDLGEECQHIYMWGAGEGNAAPSNQAF